MQSRTFMPGAMGWTAPLDEPPAVNGAVRFLLPRKTPRGEVVGALWNPGAANGSYTVFEKNGATWTTAFTSSGILQANTVRRGFDLAVQQLSGDVLTVYSDNTSVPKYRTRVNGTWSAEQPLSQATMSTSAVLWVELIERPRSNEVTLLYGDAMRALFIATWSGTTWGAITVLDAADAGQGGLNTSDWQCFDARYSDVSGELLTVWSHDQSPGALGTRWVVVSLSGVFGPQNTHPNLTRPGPLSLAAEPGTNRVALAYDEFTCGGMTCDDFRAGVWTGSTWNTPSSALNPNITYPYGSRIGTMPVGTAWVGDSGVAFSVYSQAQPTLSWARFDGSWALQPDASVNPPVAEQTSFQVVQLPGSALVIFSDTAGALWAKAYDGTTWLDTEGGNALDLSVVSSSGVPFGAYVR
jgi:hypothetical protein